MATQSPEASEIRRRGRQRLIGAVAIALLLIVFVPMILDSEPRPARQEPDMKIPSRENPAPLPPPTPAPAEAKAPVLNPGETKPPEPAEKAPPKVAVVQPKATPVPAPAATAPPPAPAPKVASAATAPKDGFAIQAGAFADEAKAQQLREKLASSNLAAYTESAGSLTRIRVGPFPTRDAAERSIAAVRLIVPDAKVVSLP
jgi:DedD protein